MNQLKYLVLIPVLASMLFYVACTNSENVLEESIIAKKELQTLYYNRNGEEEITTGKNKTFLDSYMGLYDPINAKEISYDELSKEEKEEYEEKNKQFLKISEENQSIEEFITLKIFRMTNGRNATGLIFKTPTKSEKTVFEKSGIIREKKEISFMSIDKAPTFPGCEKGDRDCFSKMLQQHFTREFDMKIVNKLGLSSGKKRIFIGFKVDEKGNIIDVKARAPHKKITEEVLKAMGSLPKMIPGEHNGEHVPVKYSIPFVIIVK